MDQFTAQRWQSPEAGSTNLEWWRGAVVYQIYPSSFQDSNDDGIGDLQGIIRRLPYVSRLGVDAVWISPVFKSPMKDFGYDVADYFDIDPSFGDLADFDELLTRAHSLDLKLMLDLVLSHTSDQHPWFVESRSSRDNPKADWYVWADAEPDGSPPNNWLSVFGGSAWLWDSVRRQYYLHNFLTTQPDLNFHNPQVRAEVLRIVEYWLARGVDGFRLDTVNFYFCDRELRSNPPLATELRNGSIAPEVNPYNFQSHIYDKNQPENLSFLRDLRSLMDRFTGRMAMGEVGDAQRGLEIMGEYTAGDSLLHSCYAFELLSGDRLTASRCADVIGRFAETSPDGWASWAFSNHDVERHASRWQLSVDAQKLLIVLIVCMRGSVCLYQGEELGLPAAELAREDLRDPYGIRFWPMFRGRDGSRTPMVWCSESANGGFSPATPWLPVPETHKSLAVSKQEAGKDSLLNHYRRAVHLRKSCMALRVGEICDVRCTGNLLTFRRVHGEEEVFCAFNLGDTPVQAESEIGPMSVLLGRQPDADTGRGSLRLDPWDFQVSRRS